MDCQTNEHCAFNPYEWQRVPNCHMDMRFIDIREKDRFTYYRGDKKKKKKELMIFSTGGKSSTEIILEKFVWKL